jgi:hypothetical protein
MENYFKKLGILIIFSIICIIAGPLIFLLGILILTFSPILTFSKKITATIEKTLR